MVVLYEELGYYKDGIFSLTMKGLDGKEKIGRIMDTLRKNPPKTIGAYTVEAARDYLQDVVCDNRTGEKKETGLPKSNVLYYDLNENSWCCVRPSGTEPKIKIYYGVKGTSMEDADAKMAAIEKALKELVESIS
jgi:phosphoglucomutase